MKPLINFDLNDTGLKNYEDRPKKHYGFKAAKYIALKLLKSEKVHDYAKSKFIMNPTTKKIGDGVYLIKLGYIYNTFLIIGKQRALLIDTGFGIKGLQDSVRKLTDKPLTVVVTHSHFGVVGGAGEFEEVLVHKSDLRQAKLYSNQKIRSFINKVLGKALSNVYGTPKELVTEKPNFKALSNKDIKKGINLGGRTVEIIHIPSHTRGSLCFKDSETGIIFLGDIVAPLGITILPGAVNLGTYLEGMYKLLDISKENVNKNIYCSYLPVPMGREKVEEFKDLVEEATFYGNEYKHLIKYRISDDRKQLFLYFPAKTRRRKLSERLKEAYNW